MTNILPLLLTLCATAWAAMPPFETAIAVKQGIQDFADSIAIGVDSYKELVYKSKIFVDNSLFIKEVLTSSQQSYIIGPRTCGKTLNLEMLKTFLEIQVDDQGNRILPRESTTNYKLFVNGEISLKTGGDVQKLENPLLISKHKDLVEKYLGNYPVIYVNFDCVKGNASEEVDGTMGHSMKQAFLQHKYMIDILRRKLPKVEFDNNATADGNTTSSNTTISNITRFEEILEDTEGRKFLQYDNLRYLSEVLYEHFNQTVFIIFDNFDKPFSNTLQKHHFPRRNFDDIVRYMDTLAAKTLAQNEYLENAVVSATFQLHQYGPYRAWNTHTLVDLVLDSSPITQYFGFNRKDVQSLFDKHNIPSELSRKAHKWYNGFKYGNSSRRIYNPYSIANFLKHKKLANYFKHEVDEEIAHRLLDRSLITRSRILALVNGISLQIQRKLLLTEDFLLHLKMAKSTYLTTDFLWYLYRSGYLTSTNDSLRLGIPNNEISELISNWVVSYYQRQYNITEKLLQDSAAKLLEFVDDKSDTPSALESSLNNLYSHCGNLNFTADTIFYPAKDPIRSIFTSVALTLRSLSQYEINVYCNRTLKADAVIGNNRTSQSFIIEISHTEEPAEDTLKLAKQHQQQVMPLLNHLTKVKLVAVKIFPNKTVQVVAKLSDEITLDELPNS